MVQAQVDDAVKLNELLVKFQMIVLPGGVYLQCVSGSEEASGDMS